MPRPCRGTSHALAPEANVQARLARMPAALRAALMPFQLEGVMFGLQRQGRVLIADEMGVGKTLQAMALASCYQVRTWAVKMPCCIADFVCSACLCGPCTLAVDHAVGWLKLLSIAPMA